MMAAKTGAWGRERRKTCAMAVDVGEDDGNNFDYSWSQVHRGKHHGIHRGR